MTNHELWLLLNAHAKQVNLLLQELGKRGEVINVDTFTNDQPGYVVNQIKIGERACKIIG